ncbi:MAG: ribosome maturation factor RimP [Alphaproteobacteria bacterium]|nr:ribosome maturation factor RimP [Alphaproteobacteria bacterium]
MDYKTPLMRKIEKTISPTAQTMGYEIVRIMMVGKGSGKPTLQIMAERPDGTMLIDDCSRLSQAVSALLDVEDVMDGAYYLEISSPGIDRPLTRMKDFERWKGFDARIEVEPAIEGQKRFKGKLLGTEGEDIIRIADEEGKQSDLPFDRVQKAKLLLTDELIAAATGAPAPGKKKTAGKQDNSKKPKTGKTKKAKS